MTSDIEDRVVNLYQGMRGACSGIRWVILGLRIYNQSSSLQMYRLSSWHLWLGGEYTCRKVTWTGTNQCFSASSEFNAWNTSPSWLIISEISSSINTYHQDT